MPVSVYLENRPRRDHYLLCWVSPATGKVRTQTSGTDDEAEARVRARILADRINRGDEPPPRGSRATAGPAVAWEEFRRKLAARPMKPQTRLNTGTALRDLERLYAPASLADLTAGRLAEYAAWLEGRGLAAATRANRLCLLRSALAWAAEQGLGPPPAAVAVPRVPPPGPPRRLLDAAAYLDLRGKLPGRWRRFLDLGFHAGLRRCEVMRLVWGWSDAHPYLDLDAGRSGRVWFPAAASKSGRVEFVPVHPDLRALLLPAGAAAAPVCPELPRSPSEVSKQFRRACAGAGCDLRPHDLRRSFATRHGRHQPPQVLMRLMRHGSIQMSLRYCDLSAGLDEAILRC